jgi:hypothetical protein
MIEAEATDAYGSVAHRLEKMDTFKTSVILTILDACEIFR